MDPCPFLRVRVGNLSLRLKSPSPSPSSSSFYYCKIKLANFPIQIATLPLAAPGPAAAAAACFTLTQSNVDQLLLLAKKTRTKPTLFLSIHVYGDCNSVDDKDRIGCGFGFGLGKGNLVGRVRLSLELPPDGSASGVMHNGWVRVRGGSEVHVSVKSEAEARFVFEFGGEPECSPQVFQLQGSIKQPVFTCNFRCSSMASETTTSTCWGDDSTRTRSRSRLRRRNAANERKGWTITIHDLSGSPVAVASMVTPFVPSPAGSDRVSRSNPGAWLILRPADATWKPWGRFEAWRDNSSTVSHRFEILNASSGGVTLSTGSINASSGGNFAIDTPAPYYNSPIASPNGSFDLASWSGSGSSSDSQSTSVVGWCGPQWMYKGFVMSATVGGERAKVEVGAQHVTCTEDAAVFVALAAAADLSMDACRPFTQKLRKELRQPSGEAVL